MPYFLFAYNLRHVWMRFLYGSDLVAILKHIFTDGFGIESRFYYH